MGRLCGGAHEISGIKAPIFLHGWVGGGGMAHEISGIKAPIFLHGWVGVVGWVMVGWVVVGWAVVEGWWVV